MLALGKGMVLVVMIAYLFYETWIAAIFLTPMLVVYMRWWERGRIQTKQEEFRLQFKDAMQAMSAALNVGYSVENAVKESLKEMHFLYKEEARIIRELTLAVRQIHMNIPSEEVFEELAVRTELEEVENFVTIFITAKRSGGDLIAILKSSVKQICEKMDVKKEIQVMISAKRFEFYVMTAVPLGIIFYMKLSFGEFMNILYGNILGVFIMTVCLLIYAGAYLLGRRMISIEV